MIKPGYKTSEFWFTFVSFIFSGLYLIGVLKENQQKEELIQIVSHAVESTILIGGQALILYRYIKGRNEVKKVVNRKNLEEENNEHERSSTKPSRKKQPASKKPSSKSKKNSSK